MVVNRRLLPLLSLIALLTATTVAAQATTGTIAGRVVDAQGAAVPGVDVQAINHDTGFERAGVTDGAGTYRLAALPVGTYTVRAAIPGFAAFVRDGVVVNISRTLTLDMQLELAGVRDEITVTAAAGGLDSSSSSVGEVVNLERIQALPLNGRQFANLAATVPGVGLGFHPDMTDACRPT